jgi:hypothetical protein
MAWARPGSAQAVDEVRGSLDECLEKLSAVPKKDFEAISSLCDSLPAQLEASPYAAWLPQQWWQDPLHVSSLEEVASLIDHLEPAPVAQAAPDATLLAPILEDIRQVEIERQQSLMERIREWIRKRLEPATAEGEAPPEWIKWLESLARHQAFLQILSYVLLALVVGLALGIVFVELKAAGVFAPRIRDRSLRGVRTATGLPGTQDLSLETIDPLLRPSLLLDRVLGVLAGPQRARVDRSLTHRELRHAVRFDEPAHVQRFENLARCAERVRYSPAPPPREDIDLAVTSGQELLSALEPRR